MNQLNEFVKDSRKEEQLEDLVVLSGVTEDFGSVSKSPLSLSNDLRERFGTILRKARKLRGLSQKQLATGAEVDAGYISRIENGHRSPPSPRIITRIANVLQINPEILMMAAGYLAFNPDAVPHPKDSVYRMIESALGYSCTVFSSNPSLLPVVPLIKQGDECVAVDASGKLITGKVMLHVETGTAELHGVTSILYRVG